MVQRIRRQFDVQPKRILIVLPNWVGDVVMATPVLRALRDRFAGASICYLARPMMNDLLAGSGWADEVVNWEPKGRDRRGGTMIGLAARLRRRGFDWAVLLTNSFRSALLVRLAGIRRRIGYDRDARRLLLTDRLGVERVDGKVAVTRMVDYYGRLAEHLGCDRPGDRLELFTDRGDDRVIDERLAGLGIDAGPGPGGLVVISPGASYGVAKLWLPERFAAVADHLIDRHGVAVVISCAPGEEPIARRIAELCDKRVHVLDHPVTTLGQFKSLIRRCDLLINNDTGPRHVAKAFGVAVVTVFGPTHQGWTDTDYPLERKVAVAVDCGPCQKKVCPIQGPTRLCCMTGVTVEMVTAAAEELLAKRPATVLGR
ncbi:MAG: lipopolysaccharide heptosyltransferase II [Planctomycetes bacterium]|nr:lipopolysaccharide heptosyltransferase II [Planctomycetota bacterium]